MAEATHLLGLPKKHKPSDIKPQGAGSGLDADKVDGLHASEIGGGSPPLKKQYWCQPTTNSPLTSSTSYVELPNMVVNVTLDEDGYIVVHFTATLRFTSGAMPRMGFIHVYIDDAMPSGQGAGRQVQFYHANQDLNIAIVWRKQLSAGTYEIAMRWKVDGGTMQSPYKNRGMQIYVF